MSYERAQEHRSAGRLRSARAELEQCVKAECPEFVRADCARWLTEVESALPTVVLGATKDGVDARNVAVEIDGELVAEPLGGKALAVDPGPHTVTFRAEGASPVVLEVVVREGEKNRPIVATLAGAPSPEPASPQPSPAPEPEGQRVGVTTYVLGGVGLLGIAGFAVLGSMGNAERDERERTCAPRCSDAEVAEVRTKYYLADASLGVGVLALGTAAVLFFSAGGSEQPAPAASLGVDVGLARHGGFGALRARF